ncbi:DUF3084 domain-containing protein [Meiothermus sp. Pnk-1]|nr:DUF3084 domain-containing protein [Meiothermus sp. Pnk-1]
MTFWLILALLVAVSALVAYTGDLVAKRVGKRHWRFFGLRPRTTATLVAMLTGVLIALGAFAAFMLLVRDARETILQAEQVRYERNRLREEVKRLGGQLEELHAQISTLKNEVLRVDMARQELARDRARLEETLTRAENRLQSANRELVEARQSVEAAQAERDRLKSEIAQLRDNLSTQKAALDQAVRAVQILAEQRTRLEATQKALQAQAKASRTKLAALEQVRKSAEAKLVALQERTRWLDQEKRRLEGDVAFLASQTKDRKNLDAARNQLAEQLEAARQEEMNLRSRVAELQQIVKGLEESRSRLQSGLSNLVGEILLAEQQLVPGQEKQALEEAVRRADLRARRLGLRGVLVVENPVFGDPARQGLLLVRPAGVSADGKVLARVEFRARERLFAPGEVLSVSALSLPANSADIRRRLERLKREAEDKLAQAGWVPEKLAQGSIPPEALLSFMDQLAPLRGVVRVGVVAINTLYSTETPEIAFQLLP